MSEQSDIKPLIVQVAYVDTAGATYLFSVPWQPDLTAMQALQYSGLLEKITLEPPLLLGVFSQRIEQPELYKMQAGERLEVYRPLTRDPMAVRRKRAAAHPVGRLKRKL